MKRPRGNAETGAVLGHMIAELRTGIVDFVRCWRRMHGAAAREHLATQLRLDFEELLASNAASEGVAAGGSADVCTWGQALTRCGLEKVDWLMVAGALLGAGEIVIIAKNADPKKGGRP